MHFIDLEAQYKSLKKKIDKRISVVLQHGQYIMGPEVQELEERLSEYVGVKHTITCANGTDALSLSLMAMDIRQGDAVFCPTFTFFASGEAIAFRGATPIFVESDESTFNICIFDLEEKIKAIIRKGELHPKAILAVDLFGLPANYPALKNIAEKYELKIIEDAAQGFGGEIDGVKAGAFGDISTTSFFPAKPLGCYGDGGAIFTDNDEFASILRSLRVHGKGTHKYDNVRVGVNSRLDTLQAAILLVKLTVLDYEIEVRNEIAHKYNLELDGSFVRPTVPEGFKSAWAQYTLKVAHRESIIERLVEHNIPYNIYYPKCLHQQDAFKDLDHPGLSLAKSEGLSSSVLSLPLVSNRNSTSLSNIERVIRVLNAV